MALLGLNTRRRYFLSLPARSRAPNPMWRLLPAAPVGSLFAGAGAGMLDAKLGLARCQHSLGGAGVARFRPPDPKVALETRWGAPVEML